MMKNSRKRFPGIVGVAMGLTALCTACSSDLEEDPNVVVTAPSTSGATMSVGVAVEDALISALPKGQEMEPPVFLFWEAATMLRTTADVAPKPTLFFVASPQDDVTAYSPADGTDVTDRERWYDTGHPYLNDDQTVLVSGFLPAAVAQDAEDATKTTKAERYEYLTLTPDMLAKDTVWIAREAQLGSSYNPFSRALSFVHATVRILVKAQLAQDVSIQIQDVTVRMTDSSAVLYRMQWRSYEQQAQLTRCAYAAMPFDKATDWEALTKDEQATVYDRLTSGKHTDLLPGYQTVKNGGQKASIDTLYLRPGVTSLKLDIDAKMTTTNADKTTTTQDYTVRGLTVALKDATNQAVALSPGDSYELTLLFSKTDVILKGQKLDFSEAGNFYISAQPYESTQTQ